MNKGLDLIQRQQLELIDGFPTGNVDIGLTFEELAELEKELKALEIVKKAFNSSRIYTYKLKDSLECGWITKEEYDLLKEVLE